ncbi:cilia- and flagella-associated protein HOATZ-like [Saccostrea echinata]|uniref:cilia- and flagella-associated protein HOATZ-like n=1 Tax=Saccostrea echinata TaxID=191078 RepID=UPI002A801C5E|nr:cilia- and flagella-associated protein HOATZ-like [Saccostrea echinata]
MAAPTAIDLTKTGHFTEFSGSSPEDMAYAKTFWQSVQLQPPMESRLVSSDIKQRLRVAPSGTHSMVMTGVPKTDDKVLNDFMVKAKTMERLEEYRIIQKYAQAREQDIQLLQKHREERKMKEEISRGKGLKKRKEDQAFMRSHSEGDLIEETPEEQLKQLDLFEATRFGTQDSDSD